MAQKIKTIGYTLNEYNQILNLIPSTTPFDPLMWVCRVGHKIASTLSFY